MSLNQLSFISNLRCMPQTLAVAAVKPLVPSLASYVSAIVKFSLSYCQGNFAHTDLDNLPEPIVDTIVLDKLGDVELLIWNKGNAGRPLLLLHGLNSHSLVWSRMAPRLVRDHHFTAPIIAMTMPGHGHSFTPTATMTLPFTVSVVEQVMNALELSTVNLVGHSWGGKVAQAVAAALPSRIASLILCDPVPPQGYLPFNDTINAGVLGFSFTPERKTFYSQKEWIVGVQELAHSGWGTDHAGDMKLWESMYRTSTTPTGSAVYEPRVSDKTFWDIVDFTLSKDIHEDVLKITCPVLLFIPSMTVTGWPNALQYLLKLPSLQLMRISGDHCHQYTNPIDTAVEVIRFLNLNELLEDPAEEDFHGLSAIPTTVSSFPTFRSAASPMDLQASDSSNWCTVTDELSSPLATS